MKPLAWLVVACALAGCATTDSVVIEGEQNTQQQQAPPSLSLTVNLLDESVGVAGSPLLIELLVSSPDGRDADQSVTLNAPGASWESLFQIEIRDAAGNLVPGLVARILLEPEESTTVNMDASALAAWALEPDAAL